MPPEVTDALTRGWTVLTGNQRAARTLRQAYHAGKRAEGGTGWQPPEVLAWDSWLDVLWNRLMIGGRASALLLNADQEHTVWRQVIQEDEELAPTLRSADSLAELARSGWDLLNRFRGLHLLRRYADTADTRAFVRWTAAFERRAARDVLMSRARLPEVIREAFANREFTNEETGGFLLVGFDQFSPDQAALLTVIREAGIPVEELSSNAQAASGQLFGANSEQAELEVCAQWIRKQLADEPEARVGVIVPGLADLRSRIDRTFRQILAPELADISTMAGSAPWEFSLGVPLASTSVASAALDLLEWSVGPLGVERASRLLLSPYLAGGGEYVARAELDAFLLRRQTALLPEVSVGEVLRLADRDRARLPDLLRFGRGAERLLERVKPALGERSHAAWCAVFQQILDTWGWAAGPADDSVEFQARRRWAGVLDKLASLDFDGRILSFVEALNELRRIAEQTLFAPESRGAPIQVLGPLEAAGSQFDAVWFLRAGDLSWPAGTTAHPLLPLRLQRELGMPGSDPAHETARARAIAERVVASAGRTVFSYARETPESHQRPSPALHGLELASEDLESLVGAAPMRMPARLETMEDPDELPPLPDRVVRGGSQILGLQAACGFRAFAEKRLHSTGLNSPEAGLDAMERGNLVHTILEGLWSELGNQSALKALQADERRDLLARCIDRALGEAHHESAMDWPTAYLAVERERLMRLLGIWLERELDRPPFEVALHEERVDAAIGPLRLEMRLDRVDRILKNGEPVGEIVLDYKTGSVNPADWMGDRPDDPQVPLYALVRDPELLAGVAFGTVRPGKTMGISGLQSEPGVLPGRARLVDLKSQIESWRVVLTDLAEDFCSGNAPVSPKQYPGTCRFCEQRLLCRLDPKTLEPENLEDLADPEWTEAEAEIA